MKATEGRNSGRQLRRGEEDKYNEAETLDKEDQGLENFKFELHKVPQKSLYKEEKKGSSIMQHRSNTEQLIHEESNYRSPASNQARIGRLPEE